MKMPSHPITANRARKSVHIQFKWFRISFCFSIIEHEPLWWPILLFICIRQTNTNSNKNKKISLAIWPFGYPMLCIFSILDMCSNIYIRKPNNKKKLANTYINTITTAYYLLSFLLFFLYIRNHSMFSYLACSFFSLRHSHCQCIYSSKAPQTIHWIFIEYAFRLMNRVRDGIFGSTNNRIYKPGTYNNPYPLVVLDWHAVARCLRCHKWYCNAVFLI